MKTLIRLLAAWHSLLIPLAMIQMRPALAQNAFPTVTIRATDSSAAEANSDTGTFTVERTGGTNFALLVFYQLSGTASNGVDYAQLGNSIQIPAGALSASIIVKPIDDSLVEGTETVIAQIVGSPLDCLTCGYNIGTPSTAEIFIYDNDTGGTNQPPVVHLNSPSDNEVFRAPAGIILRAYAQDLEDGFSLKVEFLEGTNSLGFGTFVPTMCPSPYCPYFELSWSNVPPGQYVLRARATDSQGATTISDAVQMRVIGAVNIYATDPDASEGYSANNSDPLFNPAVFTVERSTDTNYGIVVFYAISGTASNGVDYVKLPGQVTIPAGASSAQIVVEPIDDNLVEGTETVVLTLMATCPQCLFVNPPCLPAQGTNCYPLGPDYTAVAYIFDNDPDTNHPPSIRLVAPQNGDVFVAPTNIQLVAFAQDAEDHYDLRVEFFEGTNSLGVGAFFPGRCVTCPNYQLFWSNMPPGRYVLSARATDSGELTTTSDPVEIIVSAGPPVVSIVARDPFASEGTNFWGAYPESSVWANDIWNLWHVNVGGTNTATFVVRRIGLTNLDLTVNYDIGGTASNGVDYAALSGTVTIPSGKHSAQIVVMPLDDRLVEGIETVVLTLHPSPEYVIGVPSHAAAIIIDNDRPSPPCVLLPDHEFHLCRAVTNGFCFRIEASADLSHWLTVCANVVTDGALHFIDPDAPSFAFRFYRITPQPPMAPDD